MLVSSVIDNCYMMFAEDAASPYYMSRAELLHLVNACCRSLTELLQPFVKYTVVEVSAGMGSYLLPAELYCLQWVEYDGCVLQPSSVRRWEEESVSWRRRTGKPTTYALDVSQRNVLWLDKIPMVSGKAFILSSENGVVESISPAYTLKFDAQTANFTVGETVTGGASGATTVVRAILQNGVFGTILTNATAAFVDNEALTGSVSGAATSDGTMNAPTTDHTWTFNDNRGTIIQVTDGKILYPILNFAGLPDTGGVTARILAIDDNLLIKYSYYPAELGEHEHLPYPYRDAEDIYTSFVVAHMYLVESTEHDFHKAGFWLQRFAALSGADISKLWTPQRQFVQQAAETAKTKRGVQMPEGY